MTKIGGQKRKTGDKDKKYRIIPKVTNNIS
jgi:hypothetical protein